MSPKSFLLCAAICAGAVTWASTGFAQTADPANDGAVLTSSSSTSTTTIVGGVILTIVLSSGNSSLESYLRDNRVALHDEITHGAGATVADLADAFRVEPGRVDDFGAMLRTHRETLLALLDGEVDAERAQRFVELVLAHGERARLIDRDRLADG